MQNLTIIFLTANKVPKEWAKYHKEVLLEAIGDSPVITISFEPMDFGKNLIQTEYSITNVYRQIHRGACEATTPYIAIVEDDTLYPKEHFEYRPALDKYAYNMNRWCITDKRRPSNSFYYLVHKPANSNLIAPRELLVKDLEERFRKDPDFLRVTSIKEVGRDDFISFYTNTPVVGFKHHFSVDDLERRGRKREGPICAYNLPGWGSSSDVMSKWK